MMKTERTVALSAGVRPSGRYASAGSMSKALATSRPSSAIIGKSAVDACDFLDVAFPLLMVLDAIYGHADHFGAALCPFIGELRNGAEFGGADRREILGMRKQDRPFIADPVMQGKCTLVGLDGEVRDLVVDTERHW